MREVVRLVDPVGVLGGKDTVGMKKIRSSTKVVPIHVSLTSTMPTLTRLIILACPM